jgi:hypothetical protein
LIDRWRLFVNRPHALSAAREPTCRSINWVCDGVVAAEGNTRIPPMSITLRTSRYAAGAHHAFE